MMRKRVVLLCGVLLSFFSSNLLSSFFDSAVSVANLNSSLGGTAGSFSGSGKYFGVATSNKVYICDWTATDTRVGPPLDSDTSLPAGSVSGLRWRPDGRYFAFTQETANFLRVYAWNGSNLSLEGAIAVGGTPLGLDWHPDGRYIACNDATADLVKIYEWDETSLSLKTSIASGAYAFGVRWSLDGKYLGVSSLADGSKAELFIYGWDGDTLTLLDSKELGTGAPEHLYDIDFHPDGTCIAISAYLDGVSHEEIRVYSWNGSNLSASPISTANLADSSRGLKWSSDGTYLAAAVNANDYEVYVFEWDGSSLSVAYNATNFNLAGAEVSWGPFDAYLMAVIEGTGAGIDVAMFARDGLIDGTQSGGKQSFADTYVFGGDGYVAGDVTFNRGFIVPDGATVGIYTTQRCEGTLDLNKLGKIRLHSNFHVGSEFSGGRIDLHGNAIILDNDATVAMETSVHFMSSGIVDGQGHTIEFGNWSQFCVDTDVTLTLRNVTLKTNRNAPGYPFIYMASQGSKLCLQNVTIKPKDDFYFNEGQLFIHKDVVFTGTNKFVYKSSQPSFVAPLSTWYFEPRTTFYYDTVSSYTPSANLSTFNATHLRNNNLIQLQDNSSALYLNQCTLKISHTGLKLTKGQIFVDNYVTIDNTQTTSLSKLTHRATGNVGSMTKDISWSSDGRYLAFVGNNVLQKTNLVVCELDGTTLTITTSKYYLIAIGVAWSPDVNYLAVVGHYSVEGIYNNVTVYSWDGSILTSLDTKDVGGGGYVYSASWSPDGRYLAIGGSGTIGDVIVYSWDGSTLTSVDTKDHGTVAKSVSWSPDGRYLVVGGNNSSSDIIVYSWDGSTLTSVDTKDHGTEAKSVSWSPDGRYLAVGGDNGSSDIIVYGWNGSTLTSLDTKDHGSAVISVSWSPDGRYLVAGDSDVTYNLRIYRWDGSTLTLLKTKDYEDDQYLVSWSPDGNYLCIGGDNGSSVYNVEYDTLTYAPSYNNGFIMGDSTQGSDYNIDLFLLSGANVDVQGTVWYDDV
jgi:WD40 repeat protein